MIFGKRRRARDFDEEIAAHLAAESDQLVREGMTPADAREHAIRHFGNLTAVRERFYESQRIQWLENLMRDLRHAVRTLSRAPGFTFAVLVALALGIGANTAMYSIVHAVLLRPLNVSEPERLVRIYESNATNNWLAFSASVPNYVSWKEEVRSLDLAAFQGYAANWTTDGEAERLEGIAATSSFLRVLGMTLRAGRWFRDDEQHNGQNRVAVLSERAWKTRFGQDSGVIGRPLYLNGVTYSVIGVASEGLTIPTAPDLWVPLVIDPDARRGNRQYTVIGRLRPGFTENQAEAEMSSISGALERQFPESNKGWSTSVVPLMQWLVPAEVRTALLVLLGAVAMVLLIACANVGNLLLARAEARRKEIAIRAALGAGASRLTQQLLSESLLLSLTGGALGVAFAYGIVAITRHSLSDMLPRGNEIAIDSTVLGFALGLSVITGLLSGLTPLLQLGKMRRLDALHDTGRMSQATPRSRLRASLVVAQISLATLLVIGAALLLQSFAHVQRLSLGFDPDSVLTARVSLPQARYADSTTISTLFSQLTDSIKSARGVQAAGIGSAIPLGPGSSPTGTAMPVGFPDSSLGQPISVAWRSVDPGFFAALRIPLIRGRLFGPEDGPGKSRVFLLSEGAARSLYGANDPLGRQLQFNGDLGEIIGIVGDIRLKNVADPPDRVVYVPISQGGRFSVFAVFVKTDGESAEAAAPLIRERLREIDSALPAYGFRVMNDWVDANSARTRVGTWTLVTLAVVAVALGMIGVYGVLAYLVTLRRHEFGVRLALGAEPARLLKLVLREGLGLAGIGIAIGLASSVILTRVLESLLLDVNTRDPLTFLGMTILLLIAVLVACYVPARRASRADAIAALRSE